MTSLVSTISMCLALIAQAPPTGDSKEDRAARLEFMKTSLATYEVHPAGDRKATFRLQAEPVLRFTNPVGFTVDGGIFFWIGADGRPEAAVQAFLMRGGNYWMHDFTSLATGPIVAETRSGVGWNPSKGGVEFKPMPGAPRPADGAETRLRQMRGLAQAFSVSDDFREKGWQVLRPMSKPFARYGKPGTALIDGAVFCFALGTDPEAYLLLEARAGKEGPEWQFALAPQTTYALKATWKGQEVWSLPYHTPWPPTETFHGRRYQPEE